MYPVSGGFYTLSARFLDPSFAFAMGWNYVFQWLVTLPLEITVAVTTVNYWPNSVPTAAWITIFWLLIGALLRSFFLPSELLIFSRKPLLVSSALSALLRKNSGPPV